MKVPAVMCIDIGSTWTKGALFGSGSSPTLLARYQVPTTQHDLHEGFSAVKQLLERKGHAEKILVCSSAKGGLTVAAIGIVPQLTLEAAKLTAMGAGARVVKHAPWKLTSNDIVELEQLNPDIILFTGGTDGGNESYNLHNAEKLAHSSLTAPIIYAGNKCVIEKIGTILFRKNLFFVDNVLPEMDMLNPEPAREAIRKLFMERIIEGKGLSRVAQEISRDIMPTPLSVFHLVQQLDKNGYPGLCLIDPGGATTDVYSSLEAVHQADVTLRGLEPPKYMRTVEGDIGMRVSAESLVQSAAPFIEKCIQSSSINFNDIQEYLKNISDDYSIIDQSPASRTSDAILAAACVQVAINRHCGTMKEVFTPQGIKHVQNGKDLRSSPLIVMTGGYISNHGIDTYMTEALNPRHHFGTLVPESPRIIVDSNYLVPLAALFAQEYPQDALTILTNHFSESVTGVVL